MKGAATGRDVVVARFGELWLKGKNRHVFEERARANARAALAGTARVRISRVPGGLVFAPEPEGTRELVARRLQEVFGFTSISPARVTEPEPDAIASLAAEVLAEALETSPAGPPIPFRVESRRSDKTFPLTSTELDRYVADRILAPHTARLRVDLSHPELVLGIHVHADQAWVFARRLAGAGGLPVGTVGRVAALLSGGIDSPVAAWMSMKRGCEVVFVSFHSYPWVGASFLQKVERIVRRLGRWQGPSVLLAVPFADVQTALREHTREDYRTVLYRRAMQRIATELAGRERATALVTGESLGQVASQTLENLTAIGAATALPVLRPLIAFDKEETIALARRIGTYELSIEPEPDCCTVFLPRKPVIRGRIEVCEEEEARLDLAALLAQAVASAERKVIEPA
jgi:thiamine biosynthesis protein ThiI